MCSVILDLAVYFLVMLERFSNDFEMKTHQQNRNKKRTEIERFDWFVKWIQMCGFWLVNRTLG